MFALPLQKTASDTGFAARFTLIDILTFFAFLGTLVALARGRVAGWRELRVPGQFLLGLALLFAAVFASFTVSETPVRSVVETTAYVVDAVLLALVLVHLRTEEDLVRAFLVWERAMILVMAGAVLGILFLFQGNFDSYLTNGPKLTSTFKKSGQLSAYVMVSLPVLWFNATQLSRNAKERWLRGILIVVTLLSLLATGSRSGFVIGVAVALGLFGGRILTSLRRRFALKASAGIVVLALVVTWFGAVKDDLPFAFRRAFSIASSDGIGQLESLSPTRYYQYEGFLVASSEYPVLGVGVGDFYTRVTALAPGAWKHLEVHNTYLGVWAEDGLPGVLALCLFFVSLAQAAWQVLGRVRDERGSALAVALLVSLVTLYVYGISHFGLRMRHLWMIFGLILCAWNVTWRGGWSRHEEAS